MDAQRPSPLSSLITIILIFFLMSGTGPDPAVHLRLLEALKARTRELDEFTAYVNSTESNFTFASPPPASVPPMLAHILPETPLPNSGFSYHNNITGFLRSPAITYNLSSIADNLPWASEAQELFEQVNVTESQILKEEYIWNWNGKGKVALNIKEEKSEDDMTFVHGQLDVTSPAEFTASYSIEGVHFPLNGTLYAIASPVGRFVDLRQLPPLLPQNVQNSTSWAIVYELKRRLKELKNLANSPGMSEPMPPIQPTSCPLALYLRLAPSALPLHAMLDLERESRDPTGENTYRTQAIKGKAALVSWKCGVVVVLDDLGGLKADRFWRKATTYASLASIVYLTLLILLVRQMESTRTPASISKLSRWSFAIQAVGDAYSFVCHLTIGIVSDNRASLSLIAPGFLAATLFLVFEVRYATLIHRIQAPEDDAVQAAAQTAAAAGPSAPAPAPRQTSELPLPVTTGPAEGALIVPTNPTANAQPTTRPSISGLFRQTLLWRAVNSITDPESKFWALLLLSFIFLVQATLSPSLVLFAVGALYSFWVPQIVRNARRGTRKALSWTYVIGTSLARLSFVLYIFACPRNVLFAEPTEWVWIVVAWVTFQVVVLFGQEFFGPAFFLPRSWTATQPYDYHPPLSPADAEAPEKALGDCVICMEPIVIGPESSVAQSGDKASLLASVTVRKNYALAPCHHLFHTNCLEHWLAIKNICPQCRRPLPPL
ncbi:hypothetical protein DACRYDRAFT_114212 [Dacryopinax primogenitus]|uniref:RING-type E3 ubiquitin transferase n=1 Tax=Dacryopinax primogenitus (strain DJM 731) TaxID=1858805 RepID=M5G9G9_DACPD|nr:uncharacterized protein DACRYDRAFT_114212 [Dacryopinax primogenitus]EJU04890.1 hypothetical protein DACRYDRAFT_114212 [Dacryopinax primogenitus]